MLVGGASLREERPSSCCVGTGVAYCAGSASRSLFSIVEDCLCCPIDADIGTELLDITLLELDDIVAVDVS
jgi:hypothetical protein